MGQKTRSFLKNENRDFNNVIDSFLNLNDGGTVTGATTVTGHLTNTYNDWLSWVDPSSLTERTLTDDNVDGTYTLSGSSVYASSWLADAASALVLPAATVGECVIFRQAALGDGTGAVSFKTGSSGDSFEAHQIVQDGLHTGSRDVSAATDTKLTITTAAAGAWGGVGSECRFYCRTEGKWLVKVKGIGTGGREIGGGIAFAAV